MPNPFRRLQRFFQIRTVRKKDPSGLTTDKKVIEPTDKEGRKTKLSSEVQKAWEWYNSNADSPDTMKDRLARYKDMDYMIYNDTVISSALELYADEVAQADSQQNPVEVFAKKKEVQREIYSLLEKWGVTQEYIRECAFNLVGYGDSFDIVDFNRKDGIVGFTPIDVGDISERIEFKYSEIVKKKNATMISRAPISIQNFIKSLESDEIEGGHNFNAYLIGFFTSDKTYLPPWGVNHYRMFSRRSEFWPFGRPLFINLVGPFRQLKTAKNLMALTRALSFPKEIYEVKTDDEMSEVEQWEKVNEARQEFQNSGILNQTKEDFSVNSQVWLPEGLLRMSTQETNIRTEDIQDVELLRDDLIMGTRIPKGYLIVDRGGWGTSSQSLLQQSKPFGRAVYSVQSVILQNLAHNIRIHFLMTGQFDKELTEFELALRFPVIEEASDRLRMKNDTLRLAADIIDNIKNALGFRDVDPSPDLVRKVFSKFSFLTGDDVDMIVKSLSKGAKDAPGAGDDDYEMENRLREATKNLKDELIYESYSMSMRNRRIREGVRNGQHYFVSNSQSFTPQDWKTYSFLREEIKKEKLEEDEE